MKEKVLITGHKGFIGQYVIELLKDKYEILTVNRNLFHINFKEYMSDVKPEYLVHLAWETKMGYLNSHNNLLFVQKSLELYDAFFEEGGKRAVYIGTEQEYKRKNTPLKEDDDINPTSVYAECKADLGSILSRYSEVHNNGFTWARLFFVYGFGEKSQRLMPSIIKGMLKGETVVCSYEDYVRDYLDVEDVASAICTCLFSDYIGPVNIAGGRHTTIGEIAKEIKNMPGACGEVKFKTHEECMQPLCIEADNSLLKSLGWKQKYTIEEGLRKEFDIYKKMYHNDENLD